MPRKNALGAALVALVALGIGGPPASAAATPGTSAKPGKPVPGVAPAGADKTAVYLDMAGRIIPAAGRPAAAPQTARFRCTPVSGRDNPHRSGTGVAVSGHGWWDKGTCSNDRAKVYNCLYEYYTDNSWRQKACSPRKELKPGGGSSNRTVARHDCADTLRTSWRNHVDVNVIGQIDTPEKPMNGAVVDCRVY
ncbi:hypothetical protein [Streptomyces sp. NK08204]|uniref:hypothetical protein n=1 Tax=Streptomyces sp. NK08204 TaxID=2873260 RepID=UPI001CED865D|nr:hypothetical protein [Streptomyces sp. NK08204]